MMVWQRIGSALIAAPLVLWAVYVGGVPFMVLLMAMALIAWYEVQAMQPEADQLIACLGYLLLLLVIYTGWRWQDNLVPIFTAALFILLATLLWRYDANRWPLVTHAVTAFCYLSFPLVYLLKLGSLSAGWRWIVLLLACVWSYDSFAFFYGCAFGKHRPWPRISPKKSLEGVLGGLIGCMFVAVLAFCVLFPHLGIRQQLGLGLPFGLIVGVLAQTGDLFESALKRTFAVKDSGRFLPGHGGLLDRIDSVLFATPFVYYFLMTFML